MRNMKSHIIFSLFLLTIYHAHARDSKMFLYRNIYASDKTLSYTLTPLGKGYCMYGVYNPGTAHLVGSHTYVRIHYKSATPVKCSFHESWQDFTLKIDQKPSYSVRIRWYSPVNDFSYVTVYDDNKKIVCKILPGDAFLNNTVYLIVGASHDGKCEWRRK